MPRRAASHRCLGVSPRQRVLAIGGAVAWVVLTSPGVAAADDPVLQASVYNAGNSTPVLYTVTADDLTGCPTTAGELTEDKSDGTTVTIAYGGGAAPTWTLGTVLTCGTDPVLAQPIGDASFGAITVFGANGGPEGGSDSTLVPGDLEQPSDFADPSQNPLIIENGSTEQYDRPWRGGSDADFSDEVVSDNPIQIAVYTGARLPVTVIASLSATSVGSPVSLSARVSGTSSSDLSYNWSFQDGTPSTSTSADPQVTFAQAGNWDVALQVTDDQGEGGTGSTTITVGSLPPVTTTGPTTGAFTTTTPMSPTTAAPTRDPGHRSGTSTTVSTPSRTRSTPATATTPRTTSSTTTSSGQAAGDPNPTSTTSATSTTTTVTTTAATTSAAASSSPAPAPAPTSSTLTAPSTPATSGAGPAPGSGSARTAPPRQSGAARARRPRVTGRLIADITPLPADDSPLSHVTAVGTAAASLPSAGGPGRTSTTGIVAGILAVIALLGLGAAGELRGRWRR